MHRAPYRRGRSVLRGGVRPAGAAVRGGRQRIDAVFGPLVDQPLDTAALQRKPTGQYGLDASRRSDYRIVRDDGERGLRSTSGAVWGPNFLRVGMSIESDYEGGTVANAGARLLMTGVNSLDGELLLDSQLGEDPHFIVELFQPTHVHDRPVRGAGFRYQLETLQIVQDGRRVAQYRNRDTDVSLALGAELSNWGEVRIGVRRGPRRSSRVMIGEPVVPGEDFDIGAAFLEFGYERARHSAYFPSTVRRSGPAGCPRTKPSCERRRRHRRGPPGSWRRTSGRNSLVLSMEGGSALDDEVVSPQELFTLGGFLSLSGLPRDALIGTQYGIVRTIAYRRVSRAAPALSSSRRTSARRSRSATLWPDKDAVDFSDLKTGWQCVPRRRDSVRAALSRGRAGEGRRRVLPHPRRRSRIRP